MSIDRPRSAAVSPRSAAVSVAAASLLVLSLATGCSAQPAPAETSASTAPLATATPSPTAEPTHTIAFGGDCANVFGPDGEAELLDARLEAVPTGGWIRPAIGTLGGIECTWMVHTADATTEPIAVGVQVLPLDEVPASFQDEVAAVNCEPAYDALACRQGRAEGQSWLIARADYSAGATPPRPDQALIDNMLDRVAERVGDFAVPIGLAKASSWWTLGATCEELGTKMGLEALFGEGYRTGWWEGNPMLQWDYRLTASQGVEQICQWFPDYERTGAASSISDVTTARAWPGAAWDESFFSSGEPLDVEGAERAVIREHDLWASDGVNVVSVSRGQDPAAATELLERFLQAQKG